MGDNKKLNIQRYKKSPKGILEFARLLESAPSELKERIIAQAKEEDPEFLEGVMKQVEGEHKRPEVKELRLDRYKRSTHGQLDFACLLEQSAPHIRSVIVEQARKQDAEFIEVVLNKSVFFEDLIYLDEGIMAEVLGETPAKVLAYALSKMPKEFRDTLLKNVSHRTVKQMQDEEENFGPEGPVEALILGARRQILKIGRALEKQDKFTFEVPDSPRIKKPEAA